MHYKEDSYPANWLDAEGVDLLMHFFYSASFHAAELLAKDPTAREDTITGSLIGQLTCQNVHLDASEFPGIGSNKTVFRFDPQPKESKTGADIGVVVTTRNYDLNVTRATLIQCKKTHFQKPYAAMAGGNYTRFGDPECATTLFGQDSRQQTLKLLCLTSASFFLLYNPPLRPWERLSDSDVLRRTKELRWFADVQIDIEYDDVRQEFDEVLQWFLGPIVIPATTVMGCFEQPKSKTRQAARAPSGIERVVRYGSRLYDFMVNDVLQGKVGDSREEVIRAATGGRREIFDPAYTLRFEIIDHR